MSDKQVRCGVTVPRVGKVCGEVAGIILPGGRAACPACALRLLAKQRGILQKDIAEQLEVSRETVNRIMRGTRRVSSSLRMKVQRWAIDHV